MTFFFARISESAEVQRMLREESFALITGAKGVGTTALLSHEYSRWQGAKYFIPSHAHGGNEVEMCSALQRMLGVEADAETVLSKRIVLLTKTLQRLEVREPILLSIDDVPPPSVQWLRSLAKAIPWLQITASVTANPAEPPLSHAVVLSPFSTVQKPGQASSEAAAFVMGALRAADPLRKEGRADSAMAEEVVEVVGGNALLLSRLASVAADRGMGHVLEMVRKRTLGEITSALLDDAQESLDPESKAIVAFVAALPATIGIGTLRAIFASAPSSENRDRGQEDAISMLQARSILVSDATGRVTVPTEFRRSSDAAPLLQTTMERTARILIEEYASFESRLAKDLVGAVEALRYDRGLLQWIALGVNDSSLSIQSAMILARFALYSADEQTLAKVLRSAKDIEPSLRGEALFALAEAYRAVGKADRADPLVEELLCLPEPRAQATGLLTRARLRSKRGAFLDAHKDITEALELKSHLRESELIRALLGRAIISMSSCDFENATLEFRAALAFVDARGLFHERAEVLAWMAHCALVRLELDEAEAVLGELEEILKRAPAIYARIEGASCRAMLRGFRMEWRAAAEELHHAVRVAREAGLRLSELDLHLDRARMCLLAGDVEGHESALSEIEEIAADWAAPARVLYELEKHRWARRLIRGEISLHGFIDEVLKTENAGTPGAIFALFVLFGFPALSELVQAHPSSIADLQARADALQSERDAYTRGFLLMLHRVAQAAEGRLGILWRTALRPAGTLWVSVSASYFAFDDGESELETRPQLLAILRRLTNERNVRPGQPVSSSDLTDSVWPGEKMLQKASKNRLHVALAKLRGLGLSRVILSQDGGYLLDPSIPVVRVFDPLI